MNTRHFIGWALCGKDGFPVKVFRTQERAESDYEDMKRYIPASGGVCPEYTIEKFVSYELSKAMCDDAAAGRTVRAQSRERKDGVE